MLIATPAKLMGVDLQQSGQDGESEDAETTEILDDDRFLGEVDRVLREGGLLQMPTAAYRDAMTRLQIGSNYDALSLSDHARIARNVGSQVNAVLVVDALEYSGYSAFLYTYRSLTGNVRLLDVDAIHEWMSAPSSREGAPPPNADAFTLWNAELKAVDLDGLGQDTLLVLSSITPGLYNFAKADEYGRLRVYRKFAGAVRKELEDSGIFKNPRSPATRPNIATARIVNRHAEQASFSAGYDIYLEASGTPGCSAEAILPGFSHPFPIEESATNPGLYRGVIRIPDGFGYSRGRICVRIRDGGLRYHGTFINDEIVIEAPPTGDRRILESAVTREGLENALRDLAVPVSAEYRRVNSVDASEGAASKPATGDPAKREGPL